MTVERRIVVGLDDIKAISFECTQCFTRHTVTPDNPGEVPYQCARCGAVWVPGVNGVNLANRAKPLIRILIETISKILVTMKEDHPVRVLLEFEEPKE